MVWNEVEWGVQVCDDIYPRQFHEIHAVMALEMGFPRAQVQFYWSACINVTL